MGEISRNLFCLTHLGIATVEAAAAMQRVFSARWDHHRREGWRLKAVVTWKFKNKVTELKCQTCHGFFCGQECMLQSFFLCWYGPTIASLPLKIKPVGRWWFIHFLFLEQKQPIFRGEMAVSFRECCSKIFPSTNGRAAPLSSAYSLIIKVTDGEAFCVYLNNSGENNHVLSKIFPTTSYWTWVVFWETRSLETSNQALNE